MSSPSQTQLDATASARDEHSRSSASDRRVRALDGLRGVAVLLVCAGHSLEGRLPDHSLAWWLTLPVRSADLGVQVFFVLSGYLISSILLGEREMRRPRLLTRFYLRRALRILPAYYAFLALIVVLSLWTGSANTPPEGVFVAATFLSDYAPAAQTDWLNHTWSLAVEEQFYLLWPLILIRYARRAGWIALSVVVALPAVRVTSYLASGGFDYRFFHNRVDSLLIGAVLALVMRGYPVLPPYALHLTRRPATHLTAVAVLLASTTGAALLHGWWTITLAWTLNGVAISTLIAGAVSGKKEQVLIRVLSSRVLVGVGLISYSLYLWQELFTPVGSALPLWLGLPVMVLVATASYHVVEMPFLRLKSRLG